MLFPSEIGFFCVHNKSNIKSGIKSVEKPDCALYYYCGCSDLNTIKIRRTEMKTKKINLNWPSVLLGMVLCMVLVIFLGSKTAGPQIANTPQPGTMQRAANVTDVWDKTIAMEERLIRMEKKIDTLIETMHVVAGTVRSIYKNDIQDGKKK
jgi:hypothetical protein